MSVEGSVFPLGTWVVCVTRLGQEVEGEVLSFDSSSSLIVLKLKSQDDNPRNQTVHLGIDEKKKIWKSDLHLSVYYI